MPLTAVLRGIDAAFEKWRGRKSKIQMVNSLAYCAQAVLLEAQIMAGSGQATPRAAAAPPFPEADLREYLATNAKQVREAGFSEIAAALEKLAAESGQHYQDLEQLEQRLTALEEKLIATLKSVQTEEQLVRDPARARCAASAVSGKDDRRSALHAGTPVCGTPVAQSIRAAAIESFLSAMNVLDQMRLLLRLFWQPGAAMSGILDRGSLLFASASVLVVSLLLPRFGFGFYTPLLILAVVYVPGVLLIAQLIGGAGGFSAGFQRDYSPLLTCASMAWSAANIPLLVLARTLPLPVFSSPLAALTYLYFAVLMFFAVRTVFGVGNGAAAGAVSLSWIPLAGAAFLWGPLQFILGWVASPFFLFYAYYYLGGEFTNLGAGFRQQQSFRRMLEAATVNPHDSDARYQLGLIYQQRRQYTEAIQQFQAAVAIDPKETDAHFQLGRIALEQGRLKDAILAFSESRRAG